MKYNNYFIYIFLISLCNDYCNDITFNEDVTCNSNIIVLNTITANDSVIINGDFCQINDTININPNTNATITFNEGSLIQINPIKYSGNNPTYLILDKTNNQLYSTNNLNTDLATTTSLTVNDIESPLESNLNIGSETDIITIGNNNNQCAFDILTINSTMNSKNNNPITFNGNISFINNLQANTISCNQASVLIKNNENLPIMLKTKTFTMNEPIISSSNINIGANDGSSSIKINGPIITENILFGSAQYPVITIQGLPTITDSKNIQSYIAIKDNIIYQIKNTFQNETVAVYTIETPLSIQNIQAKNISLNNIAEDYQNSAFNIYSNDITFQTTNNTIPIFDSLTSTSKVIINKPSPSTNTFQAVTYNLLCPSITIYQLLTYTYASPIKKIELTSSSSYYMFTGLEVAPISKSIWRLYLTPENELVGKKMYNSSNLINFSLQSILLENNTYLNIIPKKYMYKDSYQMYNNDICPKTKEKIIHYGFITEELATLNIPELIIYDKNNEACHYDSTLLWDILNNVIELFKIKLTTINDKISILNQYYIELEAYLKHKNLIIKKKQKIIKEIKSHIQKTQENI